MKKVLTSEEQTELDEELMMSVSDYIIGEIHVNSDNHLLEISDLIDQGADVNCWYQFTGAPMIKLLHQAAADLQNPMLIKLLIEKGAEIDSQDSNGNTALHYATSNLRLSNVIELLANGADPNIKNHTFELTPMHRLFNFDNYNNSSKKETALEILKLLLDKGADPNILDAHEYPVLYHAAKSRLFMEAVSLLIKNGARSAEVLNRLIDEEVHINSDTMDILKVAIIFDEDGIRAMGKSSKTQLIEEFNFKTDLDKDNYNKFFQHLLALKVKNVMAKGYKAVAELLDTVNENMQIFKSEFGISPEKMYQGSVLDSDKLCKDGDYSKLSLQGAASIHVLYLIAKGELSFKVAQENLPADLFEALKILGNCQSDNTEETTVDVAGQSASEGAD